MLKNIKSTEDFTMLSVINHELRNPIHGISGISHYLMENWDILDDKQKKLCVQDIFQGANVLQNMVDKLFQLSNLNNKYHHPTNVDIVALSQEAINRIKLFMIDKNAINIFLESKEKNINIAVDEFWINQLLYNLIFNAQKHANAKNIKIQIDIVNNDVVIAVIDDGIGIPKNELDKIFDPFVQSLTTSFANKGFGLGLTICKQIVVDHKGTIVAKNNDERGISVIFTIPKK